MPNGRSGEVARRDGDVRGCGQFRRFVPAAHGAFALQSDLGRHCDGSLPSSRGRPNAAGRSREEAAFELRISRIELQFGGSTEILPSRMTQGVQAPVSRVLIATVTPCFAETAEQKQCNSLWGSDGRKPIRRIRECAASAPRSRVGTTIGPDPSMWR